MLSRPLFDVPVVGVLVVPGPIQDARVLIPQSREVRLDGRVVPIAEPDHGNRWRTDAQVPHHVPLGWPVQCPWPDARSG